VSEAAGAYVAVVPVTDAPDMPDGLLLSYHCHENDPVPPVTVDDIDCPLSMAAEGCTDIEGAESTVTDAAFDGTEVALKLSVTFTVIEKVPAFGDPQVIVDAAPD